VNKVKDFHRKMKFVLTKVWDQLKNTSCMGGGNDGPQLPPRASLRPISAFEDAKKRFHNALINDLRTMNVNVSFTHNHVLIVLQEDQVRSMAEKLQEELMKELGQKYGNASMTEAEQLTIYKEAAQFYINKMKDFNCFCETVKAYLAMQP
jgi:hypothetical protein